MMSKRIEIACVMIGFLTLGAAVAHAEAGPEGRGAKLLELFDTADTDKDGKVTEAELLAYRQGEFTAADTNADGVLSADELLARQLARVTVMLKDRTARMIEKQDANADGSLSADEMPDRGMEERFARLDTDKDGAISKAEATEGVKKFAERRKKRHSDDMELGETGGEN